MHDRYDSLFLNNQDPWNVYVSFRDEPHEIRVATNARIRRAADDRIHGEKVNILPY